VQDTPVVEKPSTPTLEGTLAALREAEIRLLSDIGETIAGLGEAAAEDRRRLLDVAQDLRDMFFLVVVIGEFNAGKSSFVNALLADDLLPSGITPTTEQIELVRYADSVTRKPEVRLDGIRVWTHPNVSGLIRIRVRRGWPWLIHLEPVQCSRNMNKRPKPFSTELIW